MYLSELLSLLALLTLGLPAAGACSYLLVQTLLSARLPALPRSSRRLRFDIVVPAHNEAAGISNTIANLRQVDWPTECYRIIVVADNCVDATATLARDAGASEVLERQDDTRRGKGYALSAAFDRSLRDKWADAIAVIDADAEISENLLEAFAARIELGAQAVQVHYGILHASGSWRTRLLSIAMAAYHVVRSRARERLRVSSGIRGNGWCVTPEVLDRVPYNAFSLTEDLEYGAALGLAGYRVYYAGEAHASQVMPSDSGVAGRQRQRWERGRFQVIRSLSLPLLRAAWQRRSAVCLDLALDLLVLPLSYVGLNLCALLLVALLASWLNPGFMPWIWFSLTGIGIVGAYILRGWQLSGIGARGLLDLAAAPVFVIWKVLLMARPRGSGEWVRTERKGS